jgi:hypothetical protein
MTKANSEVSDNGGRCESCDDPETVHQIQETYPILLGGGLGFGTMWLCPKCLKEHRKRAAKRRCEKKPL